jgi:hypothetical protein
VSIRQYTSAESKYNVLFDHPTSIKHSFHATDEHQPKASVGQNLSSHCRMESAVFQSTSGEDNCGSLCGIRQAA